MNIDKHTEEEIRATMQEFARAYSEKNMDKALSFFSSDADVVVIGASTNEKRLGRDGIREQLEHDWSLAEGISMELDWIRISANGPIAWIAADEVVHIRMVGHELTYPLRLTAVLQQKDEAWRFVQWHASMPHTAQPNISRS